MTSAHSKTWSYNGKQTTLRPRSDTSSHIPITSTSSVPASCALPAKKLSRLTPAACRIMCISRLRRSPSWSRDQSFSVKTVLSRGLHSRQRVFRNFRHIRPLSLGIEAQDNRRELADCLGPLSAWVHLLNLQTAAYTAHQSLVQIHSTCSPLEAIVHIHS